MPRAHASARAGERRPRQDAATSAVAGSAASAATARGLRRNSTATTAMRMTAAGSSVAWAIACEKPSTTKAGSCPLPNPYPASAAPGRFASRRACMNAAIAAEPMTDPTVRVVL